jgi:serine/threonine-protein kinase
MDDSAGSIADDPFIKRIFDEKFVVVEILGAGGMGTVYKARHLGLDSLVALKVLHARLLGDEESLMRFKNEAAAASRLKNPHVVKVISFGIYENRPYLAMELIEGQSLAERMKGAAAPSKELIVKIFVQCCQALQEAHDRGVVHRDIKPANIMLSNPAGENDFVKITDFGIAKLLPGSGQPLQHLTQTGEVFGSPAYMSPEQCQGKSIDRRADIYSLGCVLYEMIAGTNPFAADNLYETMMRQINTLPPSFSQLTKDRAELQQFVDVAFKALEKSPDDRFQSMSEFSQALSECLAGTYIPTTNRAKLKSRRSRRSQLRKIAVSGLIVLLVASAAGWLARYGVPSRTSITLSLKELKLHKIPRDILEIGDLQSKLGHTQDAEDNYKLAATTVLASFDNTPPEEQANFEDLSAGLTAAIKYSDLSKGVFQERFSNARDILNRFDVSDWVEDSTRHPETTSSLKKLLLEHCRQYENRNLPAEIYEYLARRRWQMASIFRRIAAASGNKEETLKWSLYENTCSGFIFQRNDLARATDLHIASALLDAGKSSEAIAQLGDWGQRPVYRSHMHKESSQELGALNKALEDTGENFAKHGLHTDAAKCFEEESWCTDDDPRTKGNALLHMAQQLIESGDSRSALAPLKSLQSLPADQLNSSDLAEANKLIQQCK